MSGDNDELKCARCASSLRRHGYYCRSKPVGRPTSRKRCCDACTRAKIRCDTLLPACSSCTSRGIACQYDDNAKQNLTRRPKTIERSDTIEDSTTLKVQDSLSTESAFVTHDPFDLTFLDTMPALYDFDSSSAFDVLSTSIDPSSESVKGMDVDFFMDTASLLPSYMHFRPPKMLYQRVGLNPQAQTALLMMSNVINSYPHMMLRKETFPPFINPYSYGRGSGEMPVVLKDCMGLAQMFATRTPESSGLIWRTIRMEQEKFLAQHESLTDHDLQAAGQALVIYVMMRLQDPNADFDDIEVPLLHTIKVLSTTFALRNGEMKPRDMFTADEADWQDWLYKESRRRCINLARLMNMAISMDRVVGPECFEMFSKSPLPAKKVLWEARDESQWRREYEECKREPTIYQLTEGGEILGMHKTAYGIQSQNVGFEQWYAGQDGGGILVYLASQALA